MQPSTRQAAPPRLAPARLRIRLLRASLCILFLLGLLPAESSAEAPLTDADVQHAIEAIVDHLYDAQNEHGHWDRRRPEDGYYNHGAQWGGTTALVTYALIAAGESYQDPRLERPLSYLRQINSQGIYFRALRAHLWAALPDRFELQLRRDTEWLLNALVESDRGGLTFHYVPGGPGWSNSRAQYGVLGLWEGAKRHIPVPRRAWAGLERHFLATQNSDGSWPYNHNRHPSTTAMTCAGLATLYITRQYLHADDFRTPGVAADHPIQQRIDEGLDFLDTHFQPHTDSPGRHDDFLGYYLYGVERVGLASGRRHFNNMDWFAAGARHILDNLDADGNVDIATADGYTRGVIDTSFALLFLVRGRVPVFINKLEIPGHHWHNRPLDMAHLTAWASDETERDMMWQVVPIDSDPATWLESPLLYLASHEPLELTEPQEAAIQRFIDLGGMLVTTDDDDASGFNRSVAELLGRLYPDYPLEPIDADDPLLNLVYPLNKTADGLNPKSIHNGVRHLAVQIPRDVSWTLHSNDRSEAAAWKLLTNAYFYATERGRTRPRLDSHRLPAADNPRGGGAGEPARSVTVGRAVYEGNHDPEPLAWQMQRRFLQHEADIDVTVQSVRLDSLPEPAEVPFVHVAGTEDHAFTDAELESIRHYAGRGGLLLFENVGGRGDFAAAASDAVSELFGDRLRPISSRSPIVTGEGIDGFDASRVRYRPYTTLRMGRVRWPRLLTLTVDGDMRIFVSAEDLSKALLDQPIWGVLGYETDSARKLLGNLLLHAANNTHAPAGS